MLTPQWDLYVSLRDRFRNEYVLEVGFGTGAGVLQYAKDAIRVDAIEPDPGAVNFAERMFPIANVNWILGDITAGAFGHYHSVVMIETLEHIEDYESALNNIYAMLHPGGQLVMSSRNTNTDLRRAKELHLREWSASETSEILGGIFDRVHLYDYTLQTAVPKTTAITPIFAVCEKL
jgi:2-polyprenyl-3-methyl-5-hydroxy-6-metoxy-1,4-benzoquinol methylase